MVSGGGTGEGFDKPGAPAWHKAVGITLAIASSLFIGASFVLKKKGLLDSNIANGSKPGVGHAYLLSPMWWTGMILMLGGEVCNLVAYAFSPASLVTPLGAMSVVISAALSSIFLKERLSFSAKVGCMQCVIGAIIIVLYTPATNSTSTIPQFLGYVVSTVFLTYSGVMVAILVVFIAILDPKFGNKWPLVDITICSIVGSFVVISAQGFGSAIVYTISNPNDNQFLKWEIYPLIGFVAISCVFQIHYLNKALNLFSTAVVTPIYYVCFTTMTLIGSAVLFRDISFSSIQAAVTAFLGFAVIVGGVVLLFQYSLKLSRKAKLLAQDNLSDPNLPDDSAFNVRVSSPTNVNMSEIDSKSIVGKVSPRTVSLYGGQSLGRSHHNLSHTSGFGVSRIPSDSSSRRDSDELIDKMQDEYLVATPAARKRVISNRKQNEPESSPIVSHAELPAGYLDQARARMQLDKPTSPQPVSPTHQLEGLIIIPEVNGTESYEMGSTGTIDRNNTTSSVLSHTRTNSFIEALTGSRRASHQSSVYATDNLPAGIEDSERNTSRRASAGSTRNIRASWGLLTVPPVDPDFE